MKTWKFIIVCACFMGLTLPLWSQQAKEAVKPGILGHLDPRTGAFTPLVQRPLEDEEALEPLTPTTGTLVFNFTISIKSKNLGGDTILCFADASVFETSSLFDAIESASVKATVSGSTAKCTVTIPYSWPLKSASSDTISMSYSVEASGTSLATRTSSQSLPSIKVPPNGTTTTETIASTI
jgi:hypothetical protein